MLEQTEDLALTWIDKFDQSWSDKKVKALIGKKVDITREGFKDDDDPDAQPVMTTFLVEVAGFSKSVISYVDSKSEKVKTAVWWSLITIHGQAIPLQNDMNVTEHEPDPGVTETERLQDDQT